MPISTLGPNALASSSVTRPKIGYAGAVLQVVQANYSTQVTVTATTYTDTGLSASITPTSSTSRVLVLVQQICAATVSSGATGLGIKLLRGSTDIYNPSPTDGFGPFLFYSNTTGVYSPVCLQYLDSPATTLSVTYKTQGRPYTSGLTAIFQQGSSSNNSVSSMILMEIAG